MKKILSTTLLACIVSLVYPSFIQAVCDPSNSVVICQSPNSHKCTTYSSQWFCCSNSSTECQDASLYSSKFSQIANGLNPINKPGLNTIPGIINTLLPLALIAAGLVLFIMLISGGLTMLTSASNPEAADKGKQRITTALLGFVIVFAAYWITQIVEIVLGVNILK